MISAKWPNSMNWRGSVLSPSIQELLFAFNCLSAARSRTFFGVFCSHQSIPCFSSNRSSISCRTEFSKQFISAYSRVMRSALFRIITGNGARTCSNSDCSISVRSAPRRIPAVRNLSASDSKVTARNIQSRRDERAAELRLLVKQMFLERFKDSVINFDILGCRQMNFDIISKF